MLESDLKCSCCPTSLFYQSPVFLSDCNHIVCKDTIVYLNDSFICPLCNKNNDSWIDNNYKILQLTIDIDKYILNNCLVHRSPFIDFCLTCNVNICFDDFDKKNHKDCLTLIKSFARNRSRKILMYRSIKEYLINIYPKLFDNITQIHEKINKNNRIVESISTNKLQKIKNSETIDPLIIIIEKIILEFNKDKDNLFKVIQLLKDTIQKIDELVYHHSDFDFNNDIKCFKIINIYLSINNTYQTIDLDHFNNNINTFWSSPTCKLPIIDQKQPISNYPISNSLHFFSVPDPFISLKSSTFSELDEYLTLESTDKVFQIEIGFDRLFDYLKHRIQSFQYVFYIEYYKDYNNILSTYFGRNVREKPINCFEYLEASNCPILLVYDYSPKITKSNNKLKIINLNTNCEKDEGFFFVQTLNNFFRE